MSLLWRVGLFVIVSGAVTRERGASTRPEWADVPKRDAADRRDGERVKDKDGRPMEGLTRRISRSRKTVSPRASASSSFSASDRCNRAPARPGAEWPGLR